MPVPVSCDMRPPVKQVRPAPKTRADGEGSERVRLEIQIKELLAEAKVKEFEISKLRCELNRYQDRWAVSSDCTQAAIEKNVPEDLSESLGDVQSQLKELQERNQTFQQELGCLRTEKQALRERLATLEQLRESAGSGAEGDSLSFESSSCLHTPSSQDSAGNQTGEAFDRLPLAVNGGPSHSSVSNMSDVTKGTPSLDSPGCDGVFNSPSTNSNGFGAATSSSDTSNEGSLRNTSLVSVASLAEKIHQMEENQHCTAEELQATLQELSDQHQVVQELTAQNERLAEEESVLESSFHQQQERLQHLVKENALLVSLLQDSSTGDPKVSRGPGPEVGPELRPGESAHSDQEKQLDTQQPVSNWHNLEKEHLGAEVLVKSLRDEASNLQKLLEAEQKRNVWIAETLANCQSSAEELRTQNSQLRRQLELEQPKPSEPPLEQSATDPSEFKQLFQAALTEREQLEPQCTVRRERSLQPTGEVSHLQSQVVKVEREQALSQGENEGQEQSFTGQRFRDESRDKESEIKDLKETIFELQDQVEQHQAVKLHNNRTIVDLDNKVLTLQQQKLELEKQLKMLHKKMKEEAEEWSDFQADLQTAVVVANDIKCEAQQEVRVLKRMLQEEEGRNIRQQKELEALQGQRAKNKDLILEALGGDTETSGQRRTIGRIPPEPSPKVKTLIRSFDSSLPGGSGLPSQISAARAPPAAAVSPMQRASHSGPSSIVKPTVKGPEFGKIRSKLPISGVYQRRADGFKSDGSQTLSPSQESVGLLSSLGFSSKIPGTTSSSLRLQSKLSVERKDPLTSLARQYGGSKRNALLKWCQRKTEGYPKRNLTLAFQAAESVGIKTTLDLNEMLGTARPDWQSVMQYVAQIYSYFES
ncbi:cytospin-B isoform X2 [Heptranchias perlo]|uniref:cytospin-B isoform X2 n=1 Tax=Heptranchias perlo TaxID=212740 RepID=UPI00355AB74C